ncbi:hypothetical protein JKF63_04538 [Porcisia hertigi]|uniref:Uncharacterized protein n=1 Tax=Porcisia hertigi TaxID=2761500 RepID=A0A836I1A2_9TRYP|nr:hypothetical protein JKF63_04538 [Porcisia hertigi]
MGTDVMNSMTQRLLSLEDIIRRQEQMITIVLQRLRDVEQYAAAESRNRQELQQQLYAAINERGSATTETMNRMQVALQNHNDRLSTLQADVQGQSAALSGANDKHDAVFRGIEQRFKDDFNGVLQRAQSSEAASAEAIRVIHAQLQSVANATQAVETRSREDIVAVQQQMGAELAAQRQRSENLESSIRDALRDVHGSLSGELRSAGVQQRAELESALQHVNQRLEALDQRTRVDMNQLHGTEQKDVGDLRHSISELDTKLREVIQGATNGLAHELAQVVQHSHGQDKRQETAHQAILQELAKHDNQLETVDLNWRASVTELFATVRESMAAAQERSAAEDQALHSRIAAVQDRLLAATDTLGSDLKTLAASMQETCVKPVQEAHRTLSAQGQRIIHLTDEYASFQNYLKTFAAHVDGDVAQLKQVVEAAVRAAHADLVERINVTASSITMHQGPEVFRSEVHRGLTKLWDDAKGVFLTHRNLADIQSQMAMLESAVRVELCALAERNNDIWRNVDELRIWHLRAAQQPITAATATGNIPEKGSSRRIAATNTAPAPATTTERFFPSKETETRVSTLESDAPAAAAEPTTSSATAVTARLSSGASRKTWHTASDEAKVENIDTEVAPWNDRMKQHEEDIKALRASLQRLRIEQTQEFIKISDQNPLNHTPGIDAHAVTVAQLGDACMEARSAAQEAAESAKVAGEAQDESVRTADEMRLALQRVNMLEKALQLQLKKLSPMRETSTPVTQAEGSMHYPQLHQGEEPASSDDTGEVTLSTKLTSSLSRSSNKRLVVSHEDAVKPEASEDAARLGIPTDVYSESPSEGDLTSGRLPSEAPVIHKEKLVTVPGISTGERFIMRQSRTYTPLTSALPAQPATTDTATKETELETLPDAVLGCTRRESIGLLHVPTQCSPLSEVLLPTHQFVRKREYNSFKAFTKQEIDSLWVELLNGRRAGSVSKEELLLYISQSKEQVLNTVTNIVQQQEKEALGLLTHIKTQLAELSRRPPVVPEVRVLPVVNNDNLENIIRSLSGITNAVLDTSHSAPFSSPSIDAPPFQGEASKPASRSVMLKPPTLRTSLPSSAFIAPFRQSVDPSPLKDWSRPDTAISSADSASRLEPQLIPSLVRRCISQPSVRSQSQEVLYAHIDEMKAPQSDNVPQQERQQGSVPSHTSSAGSPRVGQCTITTLVHPQTTAPAPRLPEPHSVKSHHSPAAVSPTSGHSSPDEFSASAPPRIDSTLRLPASVSAAVAPTSISALSDSDPSHQVLFPATYTAPLFGLQQRRGDWPPCRRSLADSDLNLYSKESKSPCNPAGRSHHLNPLPEIVTNNYPAHAEPAWRRRAAPQSAPATVAVARRAASEGHHFEADTCKRDKWIPESQLRRDVTPVRILVDAVSSNERRQKDNSPGIDLLANSSQGSEIHIESVEKMRPTRGRPRHEPADPRGSSSVGAGGSPTRVRDSGHLYLRHAPMTGPPALRVLGSPVGDSDSRSLPKWQQPQQQQQQQFVPSLQRPLPPPHIYSRTPVDTPPSGKVIHLGPCATVSSPHPADRAVALRMSKAVGTHHDVHLSTFGGRGEDVASQSLFSPTPDENLSLAQVPANAVPVRVLDTPVRLTGGVSKNRSPSLANIRPQDDS